MTALHADRPHVLRVVRGALREHAARGGTRLRAPPPRGHPPPGAAGPAARLPPGGAAGRPAGKPGDILTMMLLGRNMAVIARTHRLARCPPYERHAPFWPAAQSQNASPSFTHLQIAAAQNPMTGHIAICTGSAAAGIAFRGNPWRTPPAPPALTHHRPLNELLPPAHDAPTLTPVVTCYLILVDHSSPSHPAAHVPGCAAVAHGALRTALPAGGGTQGAAAGGGGERAAAGKG